MPVKKTKAKEPPAPKITVVDPDPPAPRDGIFDPGKTLTAPDENHSIFDPGSTLG